MFLSAGCASMQIPGYISRVDHPYDRKIYAGFEKVISSTMFVLKKQGWGIVNEMDPSTYERDDRYDSNGYQNLLIMTNVRKRFLHLTSMHLNVFIHSIGTTCDVEIRYEAKGIGSFGSRIAKSILDAVQQEASDGKVYSQKSL
jgi:hypothetical protein